MTEENTKPDEDDKPAIMEAIRRAELDLFLRGESVTHESIRKEIRGGSYSTIKKYWDKVRAERARLNAEPEARLSAVLQHMLAETTQKIMKQVMVDSREKTREAIEEAQRLVDAMKAELTQARESHAAAEGKLQQLREAHDSLEQKHNDAVNELSSLRTLNTSLETALKGAEDRARAAETRAESAEAQARVDVQLERTKAEKQRELLESRLNEVQSALSTEKARAAKQEGILSAQIEHHRFQTEHSLGRVKELEKHEADLQAEIEQLRQGKSAAEKDAAESRARLTETREELKNAGEERAAALANVGRLEERLSSLESALAEARAALAQAKRPETAGKDKE